MKKVWTQLHFGINSPSPGGGGGRPISPRARSKNVIATHTRLPNTISCFIVSYCITQKNKGRKLDAPAPRLGPKFEHGELTS